MCILHSTVRHFTCFMKTLCPHFEFKIKLYVSKSLNPLHDFLKVRPAKFKRPNAKKCKKKKGVAKYILHVFLEWWVQTKLFCLKMYIKQTNRERALRLMMCYFWFLYSLCPVRLSDFRFTHLNWKDNNRAEEIWWHSPTFSNLFIISLTYQLHLSLTHLYPLILPFTSSHFLFH